MVFSADEGKTSICCSDDLFDAPVQCYWDLGFPYNSPGCVEFDGVDTGLGICEFFEFI